MKKLLSSVSLLAVLAVAPIGLSVPAGANDELDRLSKSEENWVMPGKNYHSNNYSTLTQVTADNVKELRPAWSFSTGVLNGHEGAPLVVDGKMYIHTSFPNYTFALNLDDPTRILWQDKPKQNPAARAVACCDLVNRGLAYWPGNGITPPLILKTLLDGHVVALNANTGETVWKVENSDFHVGSTLTIAPYVVKNYVIVGSSGAELGVRGYVTAYDVRTGEQKWRAYATGPDEDLLLAPDFNIKNPHYGQQGLGLATWEGDAWKIGGGTNWGWYAYDPDTGQAKFGYQKTPHDEWDFAGVNFITLSEQKDKIGKERKLLTHPDRNGIVYTLDRTTGDIVSADKIDDTVNVFKTVDLVSGLPVRDPEYGTRMDHLGKDICPSAMGFHNQGHDSYDPTKELFFLGVNHICMDWEPFMLPYRAGQFFVGATLNMFPGPKGNRQAGEGLGQIKAYNAVTGQFKWEKMERFAVWGGTTATAGNIVFYGTLDGFIKARSSDTGELLWKFKLPSGAIGYPIVYEHKGIEYVAIMYGVGGWPGVGLVFDLQDPTAGLGAVGAFKQLANYTQMGGGVMVFSLNGKGPYDDLSVGEYKASN